MVSRVSEANGVSANSRIISAAPERIMMDRSHFVAPVHHVNPLDIYKIEQMGAIERFA